MGKIIKNNKFLSYILLLLSFFILLLVTKSQLYSIQENSDIIEGYQMELSEKREALSELNNAKKELSEQGIDIQNYLSAYSEDEVMEYLYSYVEDMNDESGVAAIKSINFSEGKRNEIGFMESQITLSVRVSSVDKLKNLLKFLVAKDSKYKFHIDQLSFPYGTDKSFTVTIPLKVFYN